jgi:hypothetical protein
MALAAIYGGRILRVSHLATRVGRPSNRANDPSVMLHDAVAVGASWAVLACGTRYQARPLAA